MIAVLPRLPNQGLGAGLALLMLGCAGSDRSATNRTVWVADGPPVNCISTSQFRTFRVADNRTINFEQNRNAVWQNSLPVRCKGLTFGQKVRLNNRSPQLCSSDTITLTAMSRGPSPIRCQLGSFQPMKRVPVPEPDTRGR